MNLTPLRLQNITTLPRPPCRRRSPRTALVRCPVRRQPAASAMTATRPPGRGSAVLEPHRFAAVRQRNRFALSVATSPRRAPVAPIPGRGGRQRGDPRRRAVFGPALWRRRATGAGAAAAGAPAAPGALADRPAAMDAHGACNAGLRGKYSFAAVSASLTPPPLGRELERRQSDGVRREYRRLRGCLFLGPPLPNDRWPGDPAPSSAPRPGGPPSASRGGAVMRSRGGVMNTNGAARLPP